MKLKLILPLYNVEKWIEFVIDSIMKQSYKDFECYFLNDCSTDNTENIIKEKIKNDHRFHLITNEKNLNSVGNLWNNIPKVTNPTDFIVVLDGDDWFPHTKVLENVMDKFREGYKFIHGQYIEVPQNILVDEGHYDRDIIKNKSYRKDRWRCSGLRCFVRQCWDNIKLEDITDPDTGEFYIFTGDQAYTFPILEASHGMIYRFDEPIHVYNRLNPINDDKLTSNGQRIAELKIRGMSELEWLQMMKERDNLKLWRLK